MQDGRYLEGGILTLAYSCDGADQASKDALAILSQIGVAVPLTMPVTITASSVEPSPSPGEVFEVDFTWDFTIDQGVVSALVNFLGYSELTASTGSMAIAPSSGATGSLNATAGSHVVALGDGTVPVGFSDGPHAGTFTRTAAVDEPIVFAPGTINTTVVTQATPAGVKLTCAPGEGSLTMTDQDGVAPSTTTTTRPEVIATTTTTAAPTTTAQVQGVAQTRQLPRTGVSSLALAGIAIGLIDLGYLALVAARSRRQRPSLAP